MKETIIVHVCELEHDNFKGLQDKLAELLSYDEQSKYCIVLVDFHAWIYPMRKEAFEKAKQLLKNIEEIKLEDEEWWIKNNERLYEIARESEKLYDAEVNLDAII